VIFTKGIGITFIETMNKIFGNNYLPIFIQNYNKVKYSFKDSTGSNGFYLPNKENVEKKKI